MVAHQIHAPPAIRKGSQAVAGPRRVGHASIGPVPLAVTTNFNINFLRRPAQRDLIAETKLMKLGKRLAVGEVAICSEGHEDPVAHVTATYSIPGRELP